jgi:predicted dehydrogenase
MQPLKLLQIGAGGRAQEHLRSIERTPEIELVGLCDIDEAKGREVATRFGISHFGTDMATMIAAHPEAELVSIITPPTLRTSVVEPAIDAGARAVLIEKPLALSPGEARRLTALGGNHFIAVNTQYGWMPHYQRLWQLLETGALGELRSIRASTRENILEQGPHILDLALRVAHLGGLGAPQTTLAAASGLKFFGSTPVPADVSATIAFENPDARLHFNAGPSAPSTGDAQNALNIQLEVTGTRGRFHATLTRGWTLQTDSQTEGGETSWVASDQAAQSGLFAALRDAIHDETWRDFPTEITRANAVSNVMFACYTSALEHRTVFVDEPQSDDLIERLNILA